LTVFNNLDFIDIFFFLESEEREVHQKYYEMLKWLSTLSAGFLVFSVQLGIPNIPNLLAGEIFPSEIR
jgi:hypothetical protein